MKTLGTAGCPPYHLAFVIGGTSAEACLKTVKLATTGYLDHLPTQETNSVARFRDVEPRRKCCRRRIRPATALSSGENISPSTFG